MATPGANNETPSTMKSGDRIDLTSQTINGYRVLHLLGSGGMADVYLAFHEQLQRHVALKIMRPDLAASKDHIQRFLQEARSAASLIHPNIVQVYDIGTWDKLHYIAQEYIAGNTLRSFIQRKSSLSQPEALSITMQIAAALHKAATIGVVHRDIKPDNVLLTADGEVKVADFGLARVRTQSQGLTEIGVALGTPTYMSPEQIQGQAVDTRSDLYSLGATAYEMLAGRPPFEGETALALALQHLQNNPPDLKTLRPDIDEEFIGTIHKLLAKSPNERFDSAGELVRAIKKIVERLSLAVSLDHPLPLSGIKLDHVAVIGPQTTHLQAVALKTRRAKQKTFFKYAQGPLIGLAVGFLALAMARFLFFRPLVRQPSLRTPDAVRMEETIQRQYFNALMSNRPMDWRAVESRFPPNKLDAENINYNVKAWMQYTWFCLANDRLAEARECLEKIARNRDPNDLIIHALSAVAEGVLASYENSPGRAEAKFQEAKAINQRLSVNEQEILEEAMPYTVWLQWDSGDGKGS